jgi:hypothetical protein
LQLDHHVTFEREAEQQDVAETGPDPHRDGAERAPRGLRSVIGEHHRPKSARERAPMLETYIERAHQIFGYRRVSPPHQIGVDCHRQPRSARGNALRFGYDGLEMR